MRVLLGSGGFRTPERIAFLTQQMRAFFGDIDRLLFIPYALADHDGYVAALRQRGLDGGYRLEGIHRHPDPVAAVRDAQGLFVGGGNTFRLLGELYARGLLGPIRDRVRQGMPYLGVSAGSNVACPTIKTTNDMPITQPPSLDALGLVSFQINPHYYTGQNYVKHGDSYQEHFGETRDDRIREFHEMNTTPVVGLWEAGTLWVQDGKVTLAGAAARVFRKGLPAVDVEPGADLAGLLTPAGPRVSYTVTATFTQAAVADEWLAWLRGGHVAEVIAAGAISAEMVELDVTSGRAIEVRYVFPSQEVFERYEREHASRLREKGMQLFPAEKGISLRRSRGVMLG